MRQRHYSILIHILWTVVPAGSLCLALLYASISQRMEQEGERFGDHLVQSSGMALVGILDRRGAEISHFLEEVAQKGDAPDDLEEIRTKTSGLTKSVPGITAIYQLDRQKIITHLLFGGRSGDIGGELITNQHEPIALNSSQSISAMKITTDTNVPYFRWFQQRPDQSWIVLDWDVLDFKSLCDASKAVANSLTIGLAALGGHGSYFGCSPAEQSHLQITLQGKSDPESSLTRIRTDGDPAVLFWRQATHLPVAVIAMIPPMTPVSLRRDFDRLFLGFLTTGILLAWVLAKILTTRIQRSLRPLEAAMVQVGDGPLGAALTDDGAAEIVHLKKTFNHMARSVYYSHEKARSVTKMALALAEARHMTDLVMKATELASRECACQMAWFEIYRDGQGNPLIPASSWLWGRSETRTEPNKDVDNFALDQGSGLQDLSFPIRAGTTTIGRLHLYVREAQEGSKVDLAQALVSTIERALAQALGVQRAVVVQVAAEAAETIFRANTEISTVTPQGDYRVMTHLDHGDALSHRFFHTMVHPEDGSLCLVMGVSKGRVSLAPAQGYLESADVVMPLRFQGALKNMGHQLREGRIQGVTDWSAWIRQSLAQIAADIQGHHWIFSTFLYQPRSRTLTYHRAHDGFGPLIINLNRAAMDGAALIEPFTEERDSVIPVNDLLVIYMPPVSGWSQDFLAPYLSILRRHLTKVSKETTPDTLCAQMESLSDYYGTSLKSRSDAFFWSLEVLPGVAASKRDPVPSAS